MTAREAKMTYGWTLRVNERASLRQRLGMALRDLADRLDGRRSCALEMRTTPPLDCFTRRLILNKGFGLMSSLMQESAREQALERGMQAVCPDLYETER